MTSTTKTVGAFEAKTHLSSLLAQVARGKEIIITKRDRPIARLVPIAPPPDRNVFAQIRAFRGRIVLGKDETPGDLIKAGRRI
jgi:prevent-host-death family protein